MDINEIKQVPIVDFLYILGIEPVKHKASGLWYHAPYRNDRNPSFRVSTDKNVWYDYGIARGGDIFNLAGEFINSNEFVAQAKFILWRISISLICLDMAMPAYQSLRKGSGAVL